MTLDDRILAHLQTGATLTPMIAEQEFDCYALHSAIARLRKRGYVIACKMRRNTESRRIYGEYRLMPMIQEELPLCAALPG